MTAGSKGKTGYGWRILQQDKKPPPTITDEDSCLDLAGLEFEGHKPHPYIECIDSLLKLS
jgi:hypothetical protein